MSGVRLLSGHGQVLFCLVRNSDATMLEIGKETGLTERRVSSIIRDLQHAGFVHKTRDGRRNSYVVDIELVARQTAIPDSSNFLSQASPSRRPAI